MAVHVEWLASVIVCTSISVRQSANDCLAPSVIGERGSGLRCVPAPASCAGLLGVRVDDALPLMEAGLDSIGAVELRNAVSAKHGVELPATVTFDYPTIGKLAQYLAAKTAPSRMQATVGELNEMQAYLPDEYKADKIAQVERCAIT